MQKDGKCRIPSATLPLDASEGQQAETGKSLGAKENQTDYYQVHFEVTLCEVEAMTSYV